MLSLRRQPLHVQCSDGSIVNVRTMTDKKYDFFITGRFNGRLDSPLTSGDSSDFLKSDGSPKIIHVFGERKKGFSGNAAEHGFAIFDYPYTASRKNVFPEDNRIVEQILLSLDHVGNKKTMDQHFCISEGFKTAKAVCCLPTL